MSKTLKITLIAVAVLFGAAILVTGGVVLGRVLSFRNTFANNRFNDPRQSFGMGPGMMGRGFFGQGDDDQGYYRQGPGMMGRGFLGQGNDDQGSYRQGPGYDGTRLFWAGE
jgi:hypothetical protein